MIDYVSLHNHTTFSIMDSLIKPIELFERTKILGQKAVAVTDHGTLAGMYDCLKASKKTGVKLIAGCEFYFVDDISNTEAQLRHIILLAKNHTGYKNLLKLSKLGYDNFIVLFKRAIPRIDWNLLEKYHDGLICTTACGNGILSQLLMQKKQFKAEDQALRLKKIFGDNLALELQGHVLNRRSSAYSEKIDQRFINLQLKKIAEKFDIRCITTNDAHYIKKEDHKAHDVLLAIGSGQPIYSGARLTYNVSEFYIKNAIEAAHHYVRLKGVYGEKFIQSLFENTIYFADQCEKPDWIDPKFSNPTGKELPEFPVKDQSDYEQFLNWKREHVPDLADDVAYLRYRCELGFAKKAPAASEKIYRDRLNEELDVLEYHGFSSYMLIVMDFLEYARHNKIRVSSGRGSVGGCLVAYLIDIHKADPIQYGLIFARFHNKEKTSFPDIDCDISPSGRDKVQEYIRNKYGEDYVAHVSNVNTITPKVYVRDISRTFEFGDEGRSISAQIGDEIADSIPNDVRTVEQALNEDRAPLFAEWIKAYPQLKEFAHLISGKPRAWSTHAGGIVIGRRPLHEIVPLRRDIHGNVSIEYDKDRAEENGLVKMDTLGLETLKIMEDTDALIRANGKPVPPEFSDLDDKATYDLISRGNTFCVFQLGSMAAYLCKLVKPKVIDEISYINALVRPSAKAIVKDFIATREGKKEIQLMHPLLERAFKNTYGYGLFEESLSYLAQDVAGWDLHYADRLRRLTKEKGKNPKKVAQWREEFIQDATSRVGVEIATKIWDDIIGPYSGYGFNSSHSLLYSMTSYYTAYLKAHYPLEFLTANLISEVNSNAKIAKSNILRIKDEIRDLGVNIVAPDVNTSDRTYKIIDEKTLMTGLDSMKYMGKDAIPEIVSKRPFRDFRDFMFRLNGSKVRAPTIQALAACGCLDSFKIPRRLMFLYASDYRSKLNVWKKKKTTEEFKYPWPDTEADWTIQEKYALEAYYLGEGMSGTIRERYHGFFDDNLTNFSRLPDIFPFRMFENCDEKQLRKRNTTMIPNRRLSSLTGIITHIFAFKVKKEDSPIRGQLMARLNIQDYLGNNLAVLAFPESWEFIQKRVHKELSGGTSKLDAGVAIRFIGSFQHENEHTYSFIIDDILDYQDPPYLPKDLKSKKVKMPRVKKSTKKDLEGLNRENLVETLENEMVESGISTIEEDEMEVIDPFN